MKTVYYDVQTMRERTEYRVTWEIDVVAESAEEAARKALSVQRDENSIATVFGVSVNGEEPVSVDLWEIDADAKDFPNDPPGYAARVRALEAEGLTTSDGYKRCICGRWPHPSACPYCSDRG